MTLSQLSPAGAAGATGVPVIVGAGLAGLVTALRLAPHPVIVLAAGRLGHGAASGWAQGGIAAALGDDDSAQLHAADTIAAGAGLCEPEVVARITAAAPAAVDYLAELGARFDRTPDGRYRLGLEGAHSRRRIVHAAGDGTGAEVLRAVVGAVRRTPSITVLEGTIATRLLVADGRVAGVAAERAAWSPAPALLATPAHAAPGALASRSFQLRSERVILATGGSGQLWRHTTNPTGSRGQGLALAARAGAELRDLEMVQFHPTALDVGLDPMPLVSEAVRGAGALLVDATGAPLTDDPLAARDVVARAVWGELSRGGRVFLDARGALGSRFADAFPTVARACQAAGIDPATDLIPVRPAAHYQCGGVTVDRHGRTTVPGLWAVGEVASTGLHGANRLASNSLLEAVVCGGWVADDLANDLPSKGHQPT
ncbi:L-aspartate oxidase, partial [Intrasporangium chromatireducens Q5-1]